MCLSVAGVPALAGSVAGFPNGDGVSAVVAIPSVPGVPTVPIAFLLLLVIVDVICSTSVSADAGVLIGVDVLLFLVSALSLLVLIILLAHLCCWHPCCQLFLASLFVLISLLFCFVFFS